MNRGKKSWQRLFWGGRRGGLHFKEVSWAYQPQRISQGATLAPGLPSPLPPLQPDAESGREWPRVAVASEPRMPAGPRSSRAGVAQGLAVHGCGHKSMAVFTYRHSWRFSKLAYTG